MLKRKSTPPDFFIAVLPDIIFILLFFFILSATLKNKQEALHSSKEYPMAVHVQDYTHQNYLSLVVNFSQEKKWVVNVYHTPITLQTLEDYLYRLAQKKNFSSKMPVFLHIQKKVPMHVVQTIHDILQKRQLLSIVYVAEKYDS